MTFAEIQQDVFRRVNLPASPQPADVARISAFINETHREVLTAPGLDRLRDDTFTFSSVAATPLYAPGQAIARIKDIYTPVTNYWKLQKLSLPDLRRMDAGLTASGNPEYYIEHGERHVVKQPATTGLWAASSSASDTAPSVHIEGVEVTGYQTRDQAAQLTGTSRVQIGILADYVEVDKFYLSASCVGTVTLYDAVTSGNVLAQIPAGMTSARYLWIQLYPTPSGVLSYAVDYTRKILNMTQNDDEPFLPGDFHDLLTLGARWKEYEFRSDSRVSATERAFAKRRSELFQWVINTPDYKPVPNASPIIWGSNLGDAYPPGRW